jgi:hypothetical protein
MLGKLNNIGNMKEIMKGKAVEQLGNYADKGFKVLQDKINAVRLQNDSIIEVIDENTKANIAIWQALELLIDDKEKTDKILKKLDLDMTFE